jgi:hypothetical protein
MERRRILSLPGVELRPLGLLARSPSLYRMPYPSWFLLISILCKPHKFENTLSGFSMPLFTSNVWLSVGRCVRCWSILVLIEVFSLAHKSFPCVETRWKLTRNYVYMLPYWKEMKSNTYAYTWTTGIYIGDEEGGGWNIRRLISGRVIWWVKRTKQIRNQPNRHYTVTTEFPLKINQILLGNQSEGYLRIMWCLVSLDQ